ncbi:hypothetical protein B0T10DRAFT_85908 [Thelonectria olida]|uniref:Uncharacterized protein n=1 Tax=Thelonectria olida TaxID=1576542 RepID=A0A9P9AQA2_9HYPO|nr:hypothetical protein B0T10DRAFT_85908 [Thelonectria olida]
MDSVEADKARAPVAPPEPISPAPSASAAPTSAPAKPASPTPAPTPETAQTRPQASTSASATASVGDRATESAPTTSPSAAANSASSAAATGGSKGSDDTAAASSIRTPAPVSQDRAPSPAQAASDTRAQPPKEADSAPTEPSSPNKQVNGHRQSFMDIDAESELSEPGSSVHSPSGVGFNELEDEIVVGSNRNGGRKSSSLRAASDQEDEVMADEPVVSHYPKRKRTSLFNDLSESKIEIPKSVDDKQAQDVSKTKSSRNSLSAVKGVILGYWRDSTGPDENTKHAVIGFIDVRERLRTRIQPINTAGETIPPEYPLPPGPGGSWVTFERVVFSDHLVGLDHYQVKEYVRLRSEQPYLKNEEDRRAAEKAAVKEAIRRVKLNPALDNNPNPPLMAWGLETPEHLSTSSRPDAKRRRVSTGVANANLAPTNGTSQAQEPPPTPPQQPLAAQALRPPVDPLLGTRPTRILLGYWKGSSEPDPKNRHAVYGILGQNDMFRVKLVRETRDGRFVDGNFPVGAGALWIPYEEVEFEKHLKQLQRLEIKEYCRVRQYQLDRGEAPDERAANELQAVQDAQTRAGFVYKPVSNPAVIAPTTYAAIAPEPPAESIDQSPRAGFGGHELRQSRRVEARAENRPLRQPLPEAEARPPVNRVQSVDAVERTNSLARREIARAEAAQGRADRQAAHRERAVAAAADAANAAAAAIPAINGRARLHESEDMQRLNKVWARQENLRVKAGGEDAKIYGGVKYERKTTGPFVGKLVSQGTILNIDGEDYVEYRVLTKPSFF